MKHILRQFNKRSGLSPSAPLALAISLALAATTAAAQDALEQNSILSPRAPQSLVMDLDRVGDRLIAVGERGHILVSADEAQSWQQVQVPVRTTLTSAYFVDDLYGWSVGHDGVVLKTEDGGSSWRKLLDGYQANEIVLKHAQALVEQQEQLIADATEEQLETLEADLDNLIILAEDAESFADEGASRPFLDLWFKNRQEGFIVGAFGLILHTKDGGETWNATFDTMDNPDSFHLNAIRQVGDQLFIAAEAGTLFRSDDWGSSWELLDSPYEGSFFGVVGSDNGRVIAYGLRGNAFQSTDWGDTWNALDTGVEAGLYGATLLDNGSVVLVGDAGNAVMLDADGRRIAQQQSPQRLPFSAVIAGGSSGLLTAGLAGIQTSPLAGGNR